MCGVHPDDLVTLRTQQQLAADGGQAQPCDIRLVRDGALRWVPARAGPSCAAPTGW